MPLALAAPAPPVLPAPKATPARRLLLITARLLDPKTGKVLTDLTFETFRHFELQAAVTRTQRFFCAPQQVESPAQRLGYLGAAALPLHFALAAEAFAHGFAPHPLAVALAGSDGGERAAVLLSAPR